MLRESAGLWHITYFDLDCSYEHHISTHGGIATSGEEAFSSRPRPSTNSTPLMVNRCRSTFSSPTLSLPLPLPLPLHSQNRPSKQRRTTILRSAVRFPPSLPLIWQFSGFPNAERANSASLLPSFAPSVRGGDALTRPRNPHFRPQPPPPPCPKKKRSEPSVRMCWLRYVMFSHPLRSTCRAGNLPRLTA